MSDGTGDAAADGAGVANSGVINGSVTVTTAPQPRVSVAVLTVGLVVLGLSAIGAVRWQQSLLVWLTVIVGAAAVLFGVPLAWIWSVRRGSGWQADVLFAAAMTMSLLGAAFVGGGGIVVMRPPSTADQSGGVHSPGAPSNSEPPTTEPSGRREGTITLNAGDQVDLDSTDPAGGIVPKEDSFNEHPETDLVVNKYSIEAVHDAYLARSTSVSYAACRETADFGDSISYFESDASKAVACLRTNQNQVATIRVLAVDHSGDHFSQVRLVVTAWGPAR